MFDKELTNTSKKALKQYRAGFVSYIISREFDQVCVVVSEFNDVDLLYLDLHLRTERDSAFQTRREDASNPKPSKIYESK